MCFSGVVGSAGCACLRSSDWFGVKSLRPTIFQFKQEFHMFHHFDLTTVPFLIKLAILFLGFLPGSGFGMIIFRSRRNRAKKELIPTMPMTQWSYPGSACSRTCPTANKACYPTRGVYSTMSMGDRARIVRRVQRRLVQRIRYSRSS